MCSHCGLCSGPPCLIYDNNPGGAPCPECNPDSVGHHYGHGTVKRSGPCLVLAVAGTAYVVLVSALALDTLFG